MDDDKSMKEWLGGYSKEMQQRLFSAFMKNAEPVHNHRHTQYQVVIMSIHKFKTRLSFQMITLNE